VKDFKGFKTVIWRQIYCWMKVFIGQVGFLSLSLVLNQPFKKNWYQSCHKKFESRWLEWVSCVAANGQIFKDGQVVMFSWTLSIARNIMPADITSSSDVGFFRNEQCIVMSILQQYNFSQFSWNVNFVIGWDKVQH
jgi:hypothetical protein